jgi:hypothetical protein
MMKEPLSKRIWRSKASLITFGLFTLFYIQLFIRQIYEFLYEGADLFKPVIEFIIGIGIAFGLGMLAFAIAAAIGSKKRKKQTQ